MGYITSFAGNSQVFVGQPSLSSTFPDGLSNTLLLTEHYFRCGRAIFSYVWNQPSYQDENGLRALNGFRRPSFADGGPILGGKTERDVYPVTDPATGVTRPSRPGATFQVRPKFWIPDQTVPRHPQPDECDAAVPQASHAAGLVVALADGSARTVRSGVSPEVFWGAVTPAGGEVLADW